MELDENENIVKSYIYENSRIIAQRNSGQSASKYFYVNDRLGSVRQVIDMSGSVKRNYTYSPFGQLLESGTAQGAPSNPFMFTGQWFDDEISQYYLRARMYDPVLMRFTSRDPVRGKFAEPMTLHVYLYCLNDPLNRIDPSGEIAGYAVYLLVKAVIGIGFGGYGGWKSSGGKFDAMLLGAVCGALSSMVGPGFSGIIETAVLSGLNIGYGTWRKTGSLELGSSGFLIGFAGGGITHGLMGSLGITDPGLMGFIAGTLGGALFTEYLSMPIDPLDGIKDIVERKERIEEEFRRKNPDFQ